jgi:hypothetical protein
VEELRILDFGNLRPMSPRVGEAAAKIFECFYQIQFAAIRNGLMTNRSVFSSFPSSASPKIGTNL